MPWGGCEVSGGGGYLSIAVYPLKLDGRTRWAGSSDKAKGGASLFATAVRAGRLNLVASRRDKGWAPRIVSQLPGMGGICMPEGLSEGEMDGRGVEGRLGTRRQRGFTPSEERAPSLQANQAAGSRRLDCVLIARHTCLPGFCFASTVGFLAFVAIKKKP